MLNAAAHMSVDPNGTIDQEIEKSGAFFIGRAAIPRGIIPTVRYYAFTHSTWPAHSSWPSHLVSQRSASCVGIRSVLTHTTFMFTQ